ncbi:MAG: hypothetical protein ACI4KM_11845 [Oscillospiraceae bacterium]
MMKHHGQAAVLKRLKSILAVIVAVAAAVTAIPTAAFAEAYDAYYDEGKSTFSVWTGEKAASFAGGTGTPGDPYLISTPEQLAYLVSFGISSGTNGMYFRQTADIYLNNPGSFTNKWTPIGSEYFPFNGTYDGKGYKISGVSIDATLDCYGLFAYIGSNGTVKNVNVVSGSVASTKNYAAGICAYNYGTIKNCTYDGSVSVKTTGSYGGGICAYNHYGAVIEGCRNDGRVYSTGTHSQQVNVHLGGICGENYGIIKNCSNYGTIEAVRYATASNYASYVGGICGKNRKFMFENNSGEVSGCYNVGTVDGYYYVGGITGEMGGATVSSCFNLGKVISNQRGGGICGYCNSTSSITNSFNLGEVSGSYYAGGVCGYLEESVINDCNNDGKISGVQDIGGVCGYMDDSTALRCCNTAAITVYDVRGGGVCGMIVNGSIVSNCYNTGDLDCVYNYCGGLIGNLKNSALNTCYNLGSVSSRYTDASGLVGRVYSTNSTSSSIIDCYTACTVSGPNNSYPLFSNYTLPECNISNVYYDSTKCPGATDYSLQFAKTTSQLTAESVISTLGFNSSNWEKKANTSECLYYPDLAAFKDDEPRYILENPVIKEVTPGNGQVTLEWDSITDATEYAVYYYYNGKSTLAGKTTATSYTVKNLTNGSKYGFFVTACVNGKWTQAKAADYVYDTPGRIPEPKFKVQTGDGQVTVSWEAVTGASKYGVYTYLNGEIIKSTTVTGTSTVVKSLTNETEYGFLVLAYIDGCWTEVNTSNIVYITPGKVPAPVVTVEPANERVYLSWTEIAGASEYAIYYYLNDAYTYVGTTAKTSYTATNLTNGVYYGFLVLACVDDNWTETDVSNLVYATPEPPAEYKFTVTAGDGCAVISWSYRPDASQYSVYSYDNGVLSIVGKTTGTSVTVNGLTNGEEYGFVASAFIEGEWTAITPDKVKYVTPVGFEPPQNVKASATDSKVTLSWDAVPSATSYRIYRADSATGTKTLLKGVAATAYTDTTVTAGKTYYYFVAAYNSATGKLSDYSAYAKVTVQTPLAAPTISSISTDGSSVTLNWSTVTGATSYRIYRADSATGTKTLLKGVSTTTYTDTTVTAGKTYYYFVAAYDSVNKKLSAYSAAKSIKVETPLAAPAISAISTNGSSVTLAWNKVTGATSYRIYRAESATGTKSLLKAVTSTTYTDSTVTAGKTYYYFVAAYDSATARLSAYSAAKSIKVQTPLAAPTISAISTNGSSVTLTWNKVTGATSYRIYRAESATGTKTLLKGVATTTYTDSTVTAGKTYYYFVAAYNSTTGTLSAYSAAKSIKVETPLAAPAISAISTDGSSVTLAWNKITGATSYRIYRADSATGAKTLLKGVATTTYTDSTVTAGKTYYYFVAAYDSVNKKLSDYSAAKSIKVETPLAAPAISAITTDGSSVTLTWNKVTGATSYRIYRAESATGAKTLLKAVTTATFTDTTVSAGKTYYYFVAAYDSTTGRLSAFSTVKSITV